MLEILLKVQNLIDKQKLKRAKKQEKKAKREIEGKQRGNRKSIGENFRELKQKLIPLQFRDSTGKIVFRMFLRSLLSNIWMIIKFFIMLLIGNMLLSLFFVAIIVVIIFLIINGFLHIDMTRGESSFYQGNGGSSDCIQGTAVLSTIDYDFSKLGNLTGTLTDVEKNRLRSAMIYTEILSGEFGDYTSEFPEGYKELLNTTPVNIALPLIMGYQSVENGFGYRNCTNILEEVINYPADVNNDAFLGLEAEKKTIFDGVYVGRREYSESFVKAFTQKYAYNFDISNMISVYNYAPYAFAIQLGTLGNTFYVYADSTGTLDEVEAKVREIAPSFGITNNVDLLVNYCKFFTIANAYHGAHTMSTKACIFWCALWAASSDNDAERGFDKIKFTSDALDESTYRGEFLGHSSYVGTYGDNSVQIVNLTYVPSTITNGYVEINGQKITKPILAYISDYCDSKGLSSIYKPVVDDLNSRAYASTLGSAVVNANYYYGFVAYKTACKVLEVIGTNLPVATGGNVQDCDCYEDSSSGASMVFNVDISNIKEGQVQGPWSEEIKAKMMNEGTDISQYFGQVNAIKNKNNKYAHFVGNMTYESWRLSTKWQIPFYMQNANMPEAGFNSMDKYLASLGNSGSTQRLVAAGCHIYQYSYIASALTGTIINPVEMALGLKYTGGITGTGLNVLASSYLAFNELGLKAVGLTQNGCYGNTSDFCTAFGVTDAELNSENKAEFKKVLDAVLDNNGLYGYAAGGSFTSGNHCVVVSEKVGSNYRVVWYATGNPKAKNAAVEGYDIFTFDKIYDTMCGHDSGYSGYDWQRFYAWNPNLRDSNITNQEDTFENYLFVGDSITVGLRDSVPSMANHQVIAAVGASPSQYRGVTTGNVTIGSGTSVTLSNIDEKSINGIIIMLGVNGIASGPNDGENNFNLMKSVLEEIKAKFTTVPIYVERIYPYAVVNSYEEPPGSRQPNIVKYNELLKDFCSNNGFNFIDTTDGLLDSDGYLSSDCASSDGLHLSKKGYEIRYQNLEKLLSGANGSLTPFSKVDCISDGGSGGYKSTPVNMASESHITLNISDLPGGVVREHSINHSSSEVAYSIVDEPNAPNWEDEHNPFKGKISSPYETKEYVYVYDKKSGYRLGMWPKDADLASIVNGKTYHGLIWPCDSAMQGVGYEHEGADLHGKCYTPIYAPADGYLISSTWGGTVNRAPWESAYTISFQLDSPISFKDKTIRNLWLGHMTGIRYRANSEIGYVHVKQGDLIGFMGFANACHLHITLDYNCGFMTKFVDEFYSIERGGYRAAGQ